VILDNRTGAASHTNTTAAVRSAVHKDGTGYVGYQGVRSANSGRFNIDFILARDDNWGKNGFSDLVDPSDNQSGRLVVNSNVDENTVFGNQRTKFTGSDVAVDPNNSDAVYMCWHDIDNTTSIPRLHLRRSLNRGVDWSGDLIAIDNGILAALTINSTGAVGFFY
jgi:hypothetical protein